MILHYTTAALPGPRLRRPCLAEPRGAPRDTAGGGGRGV